MSPILWITASSTSSSGVSGTHAVFLSIRLYRVLTLASSVLRFAHSPFDSRLVGLGIHSECKCLLSSPEWKRELADGIVRKRVSSG